MEYKTNIVEASHETTSCDINVENVDINVRNNGDINVEFILKSTKSSPTLDYFCTLSDDDQDILSTEETHIRHTKSSHQKHRLYLNSNRLCNGSFQFEHEEDKNTNMDDFDEIVVNHALEIAANIELQHPRLRPLISMHLMKKYFDVDINYHKSRDHMTCMLH